MSDNTINGLWLDSRSETVQNEGGRAQKQAQRCPLGDARPEMDCMNRHQCWEPCGEMGKSDTHVGVIPKELEDEIREAAAP